MRTSEEVAWAAGAGTETGTTGAEMARGARPAAAFKVATWSANSCDRAASWSAKRRSKGLGGDRRADGGDEWCRGGDGFRGQGLVEMVGEGCDRGELLHELTEGELCGKAFAEGLGGLSQKQGVKAELEKLGGAVVGGEGYAAEIGENFGDLGAETQDCGWRWCQRKVLRAWREAPGRGLAGRRRR